MKVLLLGGSGQMGQAFRQQPLWLAFSTVVPTHTQLEITDHAALSAFMQQHQPDVVINCAGFTAVDKAEQQPELCYAINTDAVLHLAHICQQQKCLLLQFSTDYVFDGSQQRPYQEQDNTSPLNVYGRSKLMAEQAIMQHCHKHLIVRTSWLFSGFGHNFYRSMLKLAHSTNTITVVDDQVGCPSYAGDIAAAMLQVLQRYQQQPDIAFGLYHLTGGSAVSWYQFAADIFTAHQCQVKLQAVNSAAWGSLAQRPAYSVLDSGKFFANFAVSLPCWQTALAQLAKGQQ